MERQFQQRQRELEQPEQRQIRASMSPLIMMMSVFSFENLYRAYIDCRKNKRCRRDAIEFEMNALENLHQLHLELTERSYHPSTSDCFATIRPKIREIFAADFQDRIIHHLLVSYLEPIWERVFIYDSYASRSGKGIHLAADRLGRFTRKATHNRSRTAFYMQLDIHNFFMSIDKRILYDLIRNRCDNDEILWLANTLIFHDPTTDYRRKSSLKSLKRIPRQKSLFGCPEDTGLPIGNLTSQFFANIYLNGLDQFVKHELKCRFYMRYVDDFVLLHPDKSVLSEWKERIVHYLDQNLNLSLNHSRTRLLPVNSGIDFLGYIVRPGYTLCRNRVVNNLKLKLKETAPKLISIENGTKIICYQAEILEELFDSMNSYLAHFKHADTYNLKNNLFQKHDWLNHFFSLRQDKVIRLYKPPERFRNLRSQYRYFQRNFPGHILFFQVGCFYEFYGIQAYRAVAVLKLKRIEEKHGYKVRCGIGVKGLNKYVKTAVDAKWPVAVVNQTGYHLPRLKERLVYERYLPGL